LQGDEEERGGVGKAQDQLGVDLTIGYCKNCAMMKALKSFHNHDEPLIVTSTAARLENKVEALVAPTTKNEMKFPAQGDDCCMRIFPQ
jgi:hypothetical protein